MTEPNPSSDLSERPAPFDFATVSDMCIDLIVSGNVRPHFGQVEQIVSDYEIELGGSANIFACQAAKLGARTTILGKVGADAMGEFALRRLNGEGVDLSLTSVDAGLRTGLGVTLAEPSDRAILTFLGTITGVEPLELPADPARVASHWHLASFFLLSQLRSAWAGFFERAKSGGATTSLDTNWDPDKLWQGVHELLPVVDVFLPNSAEASAITGEADPLRAARALAVFGSLVVVKCGERGAIAATGNVVSTLDLSHSAEAVVTPIDTVGAGDNFDAGFLRAWKLGHPLDACLRLGHECAASSLQARGGIRGQLRRAVT